MKTNDKAYQAAINAFYMTRAEAEHEPNIVCMRRAVDAAYAAQFKSEDYAGLVKELRDECRDWLTADCVAKAADALETVLAERDEWEERQKATADILKYVEKERDEWKRLCGVRAQENDALKAELVDYKDAAASEADFVNEQSEKIRKLQAERDALAARLAPVEDEALVEIAVNEMRKQLPASGVMYIHIANAARAAIAAIRPHIEAAERERCAHEADKRKVDADDYGAHLCEDIAAAIRSGK